MAVKSVRVGLGARGYDILVGARILETAGERVKPLLSRDRVTIIADEYAYARQGERLEAGLRSAGLNWNVITVAPGETTKSMSRLEWLLEELVARDVDRSDIIVAFGGGVVGDLTGFAAAILKRGCRFVQIPTTLLSQVDSSVGGKTAVNLASGKNLVGAFHQPSLVLSDVDTLSTLSDREMRAGYAEIVKYGALGDAAFFSWLEQNGAGVLTRNEDACVHAVVTSCAMKAAIVERDERETGERALLNLGHTFGHALEAILGYSNALLHGEAVAAGMGLAFDYSVSQGLCPQSDANRLKAHLRSVGLPAGLSDIPELSGASVEQITDLMRHDKKVLAGKLTLILARGIGDAFTAPDSSLSSVRDFLEHQMKS